MTIHCLHNPKDIIDVDSRWEHETAEQSSYGLSESEDEKEMIFQQENFSFQRSIELMLVFWA